MWREGISIPYVVLEDSQTQESQEATCGISSTNHMRFHSMHHGATCGI